ncbi:MAG TPA: hypothetical protein VKJ45_09335 [Blastocatellia bacterium]|nr:hypothetical protein [Blastocatellia bacterium]
MKRSLVLSILIALVIGSISEAQRPRRTTTRRRAPARASNCPEELNDISDCPEQGCGGDFDENLNRRKNITSDDQAPVSKTVQDMKDLEDPANFQKGGPRDELTALGEGQKIRIVALALVARKGSAESCNCKLTKVADTDNHIVLVDPTLRRPSLQANEDDSVTAEFTPRVRVDHPDLSRARLQPLITAAHIHALKVRVTGVLLFDSEHFLGHHLKRHNNWEIHPILALEYCPNGKRCTATSDANWVSLEDQ